MLILVPDVLWVWVWVWVSVCTEFPSVEWNVRKPKSAQLRTHTGVKKSLAWFRKTEDCLDLWATAGVYISWLLRSKRSYILQCHGFVEGIKHLWCRFTGQSSCRCHMHNQMIFINPNYDAQGENTHSQSRAIRMGGIRNRTIQ